ncbi:MAG: WD40 repeat domain-containing protein [Methanolinea sp.]|nr:WD40 repeat domain-containing protein [Methanolinea sp.]
MFPRRAAALCLACLFLSLPAAAATGPGWTFSPPRGKISGFAVSGDGAYTAVGTTMGRLVLLDGSGAVLWEKQFAGPLAVALDGAGTMVVAAESESREKMKGTLRGFTTGGAPLWVTHPGYICGFAAAADLSRTAVGTSQGEVVVYDREGCVAWREADLFKPWSTSCVALSPDGKFLAYALHEATPALYLVDLSSHRKKALKVHSATYGSPIRAARFSADGKTLLCVQGEGSTDTVALFSTGGTLLWKRSLPRVTAAEFADAGEAIVAGSADGTVRVLDKGGNVTLSRDVGSPVLSLAVTPDGAAILAGTERDGIVALSRGNETLWQCVPDRFPWAAVTALAVAGNGTRVVAVVNGNEVIALSRENDAGRGGDPAGGTGSGEEEGSPAKKDNVAAREPVPSGDGGEVTNATGTPSPGPGVGAGERRGCLLPGLPGITRDTPANRSDLFATLVAGLEGGLGGRPRGN